MFRRVVDGRVRGTSTGPSSDKKGAFAGGESFKVCQVHPRALTPRPLFVNYENLHFSQLIPQKRQPTKLDKRLDRRVVFLLDFP